MADVTVYRVEDGEGWGPHHRIPGPIRWDRSWDWLMENNPEPADDGIYGIYSNWIFGCASLEDLQNWFEGLFEFLTAGGFFVTEYVVDDAHVKYGGKQVAFRREFAKKSELSDA